MKRKAYIQPVAKTLSLGCQLTLMANSIPPKFDDQRPTNGITPGAYASDAINFGDARSREFDWEDEDDD